MTTAEITRILPTWEDTLESRTVFYRSVCGLAAYVRPELDAISVDASETLGAIVMPAALADRVHNDMHHRGIGVGPIITNTRAQRWTWLVRPDIPADTALYAAMFRIAVHVARPGTPIALPSPIARHVGIRCWAASPTDAFRPAASVVLAAVTACTTPRRVP
ncbi:DNA-directed RNA polymerase subunit beta [Nocardia sp. alder85J]|uniref:DNA-directed RNA polymerase subunit beta n=1 Tax=Nocardia sp. alder85J TaxID=2862949 RepID=UPI001CD36683|nr:DNA-directed RNA polymerase subunit beta [Nocardia sp. alder85J]MCX4099147.1 DNA-directed RNA polymerase subunit beta [Nocardia sp. alder85J]